MLTAIIISKLRVTLPDAFSRSEVKRLMPGVIAPGTLANLASKKLGPPCLCKRGKAIYEKDSFLDWLTTWLGVDIDSDQSVSPKSLEI